MLFQPQLRGQSDPFILRRDQGRLYGRGAVDMKGFVAIALAMVPDFVAARDGLRLPVHLAFTFDEEVGCLGLPGCILISWYFRKWRSLASRRRCVLHRPKGMELSAKLPEHPGTRQNRGQGQCHFLCGPSD